MEYNTNPDPSKKPFCFETLVGSGTGIDEYGERKISRHDLNMLDALVNNLHEELARRDDYETLNHIAGENEYAQQIASILELDPFYRMILNYTVMLHDVGKAKTPLNILKKEGQLTPEETMIMNEHVKNSVDMIVSHRLYQQLSTKAVAMIGVHILMGVANHHRYYNGTGYGPITPVGGPETITFASQIMQGADMLDACTRRRGYHFITEKPLRTPKEAKYEARRCKGQLNPAVVEAIQILPFEETFSLYAQLEDMRYSKIIERTIREANAETDALINDEFLSVEGTAWTKTHFGAPVQIGYATPTLKGGESSLYTRIRDADGAKVQQHKYGIEILADSSYEPHVSNLVRRIAQQEGFSQKAARDITTIFSRIVPRYLRRIDSAYKAENLRAAGNTFTVNYSPDTRELSVMVRNPLFNYASPIEKIVLEPLQAELNQLDGYNVRLPAKSKEPVVEIVIPKRDYALV